MTSDEALILDFQQGSREALEELFARYREPLYGFFWRRLMDRERAEDLTQETFVAVIRSTERYEPRASVRTYLYGIALKLLLAEHRRRKIYVELQDSQSYESKQIESALWVRKALELLEPIEREILMLREYEQLSYQEIGGLLRIPVNTVRSRLFRSRVALKRQLEPAGGDTCP